MSTDRAVAVHLHRDDCPQALALLEVIVGAGSPDGWERTATGAYVSWDELDRSYLSTTEKAAAHVARGISIIERHGGGFGQLDSAVVETVHQALRRRCIYVDGDGRCDLETASGRGGAVVALRRRS